MALKECLEAQLVEGAWNYLLNYKKYSQDTQKKSWENMI